MSAGPQTSAYSLYTRKGQGISPKHNRALHTKRSHSLALHNCCNGTSTTLYTAHTPLLWFCSMSFVTRRPAGAPSPGLLSRRVPLPVRAQTVVTGARKVLLQQDFSDWPGRLKNATPSEVKNELWEDWGEAKVIRGVNSRDGRLKLGKNRAEVRFSKGLLPCFSKSWSPSSSGAQSCVDSPPVHPIRTALLQAQLL